MTGPTRTTRRARLTAGAAGLSLIAGSLAGAVSFAAEAAAAPAPAAPPAEKHWDTPDASVTAPAAAVVADLATDARARIVTVRTVAGRPAVTTRTVTGRSSATAAVAAAQADDATVSVSVDRRVHLTDTTTADDPLRASQWALTTLHAERTWPLTTGSVRVAVIDTGVQADHPDLAGNVVPGVDLIGDVPASTDGSNDENGHGTHVAGIVAAVADNHLGVAGLAPGVKILPVRVLDGDGSGYDSDIATGIVQAVDRGAGVLNLSVGGTETGAMAAAVRYALSKNVVVVAAAGNERQDGNAISYPAADTGVIGVAATDSANKDAPFSNTGSYVDVAAPGVGIWSTFKGGAYRQLSGTSMATPYVSATAALVKSVAPSLTPAAVTSLLERTATDLGTAGRDDATGYGLVDPYAAVCSLVATCAGTTATAFGLTTGTGGTVTAGTRVTVRGTLTGGADGGALGGVPADVCVRTAPATTYRCTAATTAADGSVRWTATPAASTWVYLAYRGTGTAAASRTATAAYPVAARVTLRAGTKSVTATVAPAAGQVVKLDRLTGSAWTLVTGKKVSAAGAASFTKLTAGTYRLRVPATSSTVASTSGSLRVR